MSMPVISQVGSINAAMMSFVTKILCQYNLNQSPVTHKRLAITKKI